MDLLEKEWYIEAPWGKICIVAWGNCLDPPVLVCHGERDSAATMRPLLKLLPRNYYYIVMELPGHGKSDRFPAGLMISQFDMVFPIEVVRKHFRWIQFVFMSHSATGLIGRWYNLSYPGRMSRVIELDMITHSLTVEPDKFAVWYNRYFTEYYQKYEIYNSPASRGPAYTWDEAISRLEKKRGLPKDLGRQTIERFSEPAGNGKIRFTYDQRSKKLVRPPFSPAQVKKLFTEMTTPTLAIVASESVENGHYNNTPYLLEDNNYYRVKRVIGNHDVHACNPERLAPFVAQFLLHGLSGLDNNSKL